VARPPGDRRLAAADEGRVRRGRARAREVQVEAHVAVLGSRTLVAEGDQVAAWGGGGGRTCGRGIAQGDAGQGLVGGERGGAAGLDGEGVGLVRRRGVQVCHVQHGEGLHQAGADVQHSAVAVRRLRGRGL